MPHGITLRALVTVTWRWYFDEVFVKVNGWPGQANLRMLVDIRVRLDRAAASKVDRAGLDFVKSQVSDPGNFTVQLDGIVRLNPKPARCAPKIFLSPQARTIQLGGLGRAPIRTLYYHIFSSPVVTDGVARNRDSQAQPRSTREQRPLYDEQETTRQLASDASAARRVTPVRLGYPWFPMGKDWSAGLARDLTT